MALVTLVSIALTTSAIIVWLISCYYYFCKLNNGHNNNSKRASRENSCRSAHLLIVLGSGGHTAEMLSMLERAPLDPKLYTHRTYVVSSGDSFSALKAMEFEKYLLQQQQHRPYPPPAMSTHSNGRGIHVLASLRRKENTGKCQQETDDKIHKTPDSSAFEMPSETISSTYTIITVPRARRVHQSYLTAPISTLHCLWVCICVLRGKRPDQKLKKGDAMPSSSKPSTATGPSPPTPYPNIILTNGPATAVCVILAAKILRAIASLSTFPFLFFQQQSSQKRQPFPRPKERYLCTIFIESWARVTTLSLSGKIVLPLVDRFLVQWEGLEGYSSWLGGKAEFVGALVG